MLLQKIIKLNKLVKTNSSVFSTRTCTVYNVLIIKPVKPGVGGIIIMFDTSGFYGSYDMI